MSCFNANRISINKYQQHPQYINSAYTHSAVWLGFGVVLKDSWRPQGPGIELTNLWSLEQPFYLHHGRPVDAWMDEESGNIIHRPSTFTGTEEYSCHVDGSSRPSPFCRLHCKWLKRKHCSIISRLMWKFLSCTKANIQKMRMEFKKKLYLCKTVIQSHGEQTRAHGWIL